MSVFDIDFYKQNLELLPTFMRKPIISIILEAKTVPIERIWNEFLRHREDVFFILKYSSSKRDVEIALRLKFKDEGIYIAMPEPQEGLYIEFYTDAYTQEPGYKTEIKTAYTGSLFTDFYLDEQVLTDDFTIMVPELTYITSSKEILDFASYFVLPSFKYSVKKY